MNMKILSRIAIIGFMMLNSFSLIASGNYAATDNGYILMNNTYNIPQVITCIQNGEYTGTDEEIAQQYVTANLNFLFNNLNAEIELIESVSNPSGTSVRFHQEVSDLPVLNSSIVVSLNNQKEITMVTNHYKPGISVSTTPLVNLNEAIQIARNSFDDPNFETIIPIKSQLSVYVDGSNTSYLVWKLNIVPIEGDWYVLVDAINEDIIKKDNIAAGDYGTVFDPDPGTYLENILLPDMGDATYPALLPAYQNKYLYGLNPPVNGLYYLRGDYAYSADFIPPGDPVTTESTPNFIYDRSQNGFEETNCYYHLDKVIRYVRDLGFEPLWLNQSDNPEDIVFDARGGYGSSAFYSPSPQRVNYGVPAIYKDAGEDQSVIVHELGHALHHAINGDWGYGLYTEFGGISEGIADYLGIDYRRQSSYFLPNARFNWFYIDSVPFVEETILPVNEANFSTWFLDSNAYIRMRTWASSLMDLEYISATDPTQGFRLGRDIVTTLQLTSVAAVSSDEGAIANVYAMYQADINIYDGSHLKDLIEVYSNRLLFDDQIVNSNITSNTSLDGYNLVTTDISVQNGASLTIEPYTYLILDGNLTVEAGTQISLSQFSRIYLLEGAELIIENGADITIGDNVKFFTPEGQTCGKIRISGSDPVDCNDLQVTNCNIYTNNTEIEIHGGNFSNSYLEHLNETLILDGIDFDQSYILAERRLVFSPPFYVDLQNCSIQNSNTYAVKISSYPEFTVSNNNISNNVGAALLLYNNTDGIIENNNLNNNSVGINLTNTEAEIIGYNEICDNSYYGIIAFNYANWSLVGVNDYPCQIIANNNGDNAEVYFFNTSLPDEVTFNKIYDSNYESEFVHCYGDLYTEINVANNFWGNGGVGGYSRIPTEENFYPSIEYYPYDPVWNPGTPRGGEDGDAELLYLSGKDLEVDEYYVAAEQTYKDVISLYPASNYSKMAAKQLMSITEKTDQDYFTLKNYYDTEPNMTYDDEMIKVSSFLSNQCNIKITEFPTAIDWFEDVISDPPSQIDSVLAVIDLGHTYLLMEENGDRSNYVGKFPNLKPNSWEEYEENTIQLLNEHFGEPEIDPEEEPFIDIIPASVTLKRNYPNPFNPTTSISFSIPEASNVELTIFNIRGQMVKTLVNSNLDKGNHSLIWNGNDESNEPVSSGVYFYKLKVKGKTEGTKKMLLLK